MNGALLRYRIMSYIVGTMLILSLLAALLFQILGHQPTVVKVVWTAHGYLYLVYLITGTDLALRAHWRISRILMVVCAGFVPFLAFIIEHRVTKQFRKEQAEQRERDGEQSGDSVTAPATDEATDEVLRPSGSN